MSDSWRQVYDLRMNRDGMISVEEARERILAFVERTDAEEKRLEDALGQVLAEDITSPLTIPPRDNTSMDGYAVRAADTAGATDQTPVRLKIAGEVAAGYIFSGTIESGAAVRIMTGAPIPAGADAVVPFEETDEQPGRNFGAFTKSAESVGILKAANPGANIRRAGEDIVKGAAVLQAGTELHAAQIGVLASLGRPTVKVYRRPVVAILSTGDEVLAVGAPYEPGHIYDSNAFSLAALVT